MIGTTTIGTNLEKPDTIVDRDREWARLERMVASREPELVVVLGRRRAGKSYLLTRFAQTTRGVYYQAARMTEAEQLRELSRVLAERFDDAALRSATFDEWEPLLRYVVARAGGDPFVLVVDEYPYVADASPSVPSRLQRLWDHGLEGTRVKLVLCGSDVSAMKRMTAAGQPLFGRRTARVAVKPFDYLDAARFVEGWSARDRLRLYAAFGGLAGHLASVDAASTLAENVAGRMLEPSSRLHEEAVHVFDAFVADAVVHYSVVEAIAGGERRWSRISSRVGRQTSSLKRVLEWLEEMEVVERVAPFTHYPDPSPKSMLYRLTDPYLVFWHAFVKDIRARGLAELVDPLRLWERSIAPRLDDHMGPVFEDACRSFVARGTHGRLPFRPVRVGSWWTADGAEELDVVALGEEGELLVGECKWGRSSDADVAVLRRRAALVAAELGGVRSMHYALFTGSEASRGGSVRKRARRSNASRASRPRRGTAAPADDVLRFTIDDLYAGLS